MKLGLSGVIRGFEVNTAWFTGNQVRAWSKSVFTHSDRLERAAGMRRVSVCMYTHTDFAGKQACAKS